MVYQGRKFKKALRKILRILKHKITLYRFKRLSGAKLPYELEKTLIEYISAKKNRPYGEIENIFIDMRNRLKFLSFKFEKFAEDMLDLGIIFHSNKDEKEIIHLYKYFEIPHLFCQIGQYYGSNYSAPAKFLADHAPGTPVVVDYGCGLGCISFEICKLNKDTKVYLVDIDKIALDFAEFRFKKFGFNVETIIISEENLYPKLPAHNICIAKEVMEHLFNPLVAFENICDSLSSQGILFGDFRDHEIMPFHVSPKLGALRDKLEDRFCKIGDLTYKRIDNSK